MIYSGQILSWKIFSAAWQLSHDNIDIRSQFRILENQMLLQLCLLHEIQQMHVYLRQKRTAPLQTRHVAVTLWQRCYNREWKLKVSS